MELGDASVRGGFSGRVSDARTGAGVWVEKELRIGWSVRLCFVLLVGIFFVHADSTDVRCGKTHALVGFKADLSMLQHQLRGTVEIEDDCRFTVTKFDLIAGDQVYWWGSRSPSLEDMLSGFPISRNPIIGSYNGSSLNVELSKKITWNNFSTLSVWANGTASDYGHIILELEMGQQNDDANFSQTLPSSDSFGPPVSLSPSSSFPDNFSPPDANQPPSSVLPQASPPLSSNESAASLKGIRSQPTMFDNCIQLNQLYRLRWTVNHENMTVDFGLEGAIEYSTQYLGLGWSNTNETDNIMNKADMTIVGFDSEDKPFAEDFFAFSTVPCDKSKNGDYEGVCPDSLLSASSETRIDNQINNNVEYIWGQVVDGITLIRFRRPIVSPDTNFDQPLNISTESTFIWSIGPLQHSEIKGQSYHFPGFHGKTPGLTYGISKIILENSYDECHGPLYSKSGIISSRRAVVADRGSSLTLTIKDSANYPNPPSSGKSLCVNGHEAPILKVERGVAVEFSVQCGHDIPVYITSDPIGGNRNSSELIFAGGEFAHGVPAVPYTLTWTPNSSTPDFLYYQAFSKPKMGWLIHVVNGGLSDMYTFHAPLADGKVTLFWSLTSTQISFAVRSEVPCKYLALGFGSGMVNSFAYIGYVENGIANVSSYYINGKSAKNIHPYSDEISPIKCVSDDGKITFEFTKSLHPTQCGKICNDIDSSLVTKFVWAMGSSWSSSEISDLNMHSATSSSATIVNLGNGDYEIEKLISAFTVHGFMMFISWAILFPLGIFSARYLKQFDWFKIHVYTQVAGISITILGLLFAVGESKGFDFCTAHSKIGLVSIAFALFQPLNAYFRPKKSPFAFSSQEAHHHKLRRTIWIWIHSISGRSVLGLGLVSMCSGFITLSNKYEPDPTTLKIIALLSTVWFAVLGAWFGYNEYHHVKRQRSRVEESTPLAHSDFVNKKSQQNGHPTAMQLDHDALDDEDHFHANPSHTHINNHFDDMDEEKAIVQDLLPVSKEPSFYDSSPKKSNKFTKEVELEPTKR